MSLRDLVLSLMLIGGLPVALARPFIGAVIFAWLGIMNPHRMTWGYAYDVSWAQMYALATLAGLLFTKERAVADSFWRYRLVLVYVGWMGITTAFAIEQQAALAKLIEILKVQPMCFVPLCLLTSRARVVALAAVITLSIAFFGVKGGLFTLRGGGENRVFGPPESILSDNNHLAAGLVVALPLLYWLYHRAERRWMRWGLIGAMLLLTVSI
ncbi:MAG: putative O-glycosylation ligase, exosortase A system-associated, partial [Gemmatimonadetes bacterium]|nr:putative O-glycosylation ligase, exosortase A system-associated [Gemmatimonadota bacterium]